MNEQHWLGAALVLLSASLPAVSQEPGVTVVHADDFATGRTETHVLQTLATGEVRMRASAAAPRALSGEMTGERRVAVLLVDLQDAAVSCTASQVAETLFTGASSTAKVFEEMSFGSVSFPPDSDGDGDPDVFGPFRVNAWRASPCEYWKWSAEADAAARAAGVDLNLYHHRVYVLPAGTSCGYNGLGSVGCANSICQVWSFSCSSGYVFTHELGHNLGMQHAASDSDGNGLADDEYGDGSDVMGCCGPYHANAPHKAQMGWLPPEKVVDLEPGSHFLRLAPIEADPADTLDPQALRALGFYYVSTRKAIGFDAGLPAAYVDRVSVHRHGDWEPACVHSGASYRGYPCSATRTLHVKTLEDGETFEDADHGLRITPVSHGSSGAVVDVEVEPPGRDFYTLTPCRLFNTRESWPLASGSEEIFVLKGLCGIPPAARALAVNVTVTNPTARGNVALYPGNARPSGTSTINFGPGETRANSAVLALSADGYGTVRALPFVQGGGKVDLILDVSGYFE